MIPWSNGEDAWPTSRKVLVRFQPGSLPTRVCKCFRRHAAVVRRKAGFKSRTDLWRKFCIGLIVQWEDTALAWRGSEFDSRSVHWNKG